MYGVLKEKMVRKGGNRMWVETGEGRAGGGGKKMGTLVGGRNKEDERRGGEGLG